MYACVYLYVYIYICMRVCVCMNCSVLYYKAGKAKLCNLKQCNEMQGNILRCNAIH